MKLEIIYSNRKSISIQIKNEDLLIVRAPFGVTKKEINYIIDERKNWIERHLNELREKKNKQNKIKKLSQEEIRKLADNAAKFIPERVKFYAPIVGVDYKRITIRNQKTRWGSCSSKGGLNFNCLLMLAPVEVIDYVVVHELCHRIEMNHSKAFWDEVERVLPNYKVAKRWIKDNGEELMLKIHSYTK